jgi:NAD(P)-dependent dehydrogenase (short-subunit alcohol dehydrogenase family)
MLVHGGGVIVHCSSSASTKALGGLALYVAAKAGVHALTRNAAVEYSAQGIRTVAIAPGVIETALQQQTFAQLDPEVRAKLTAMHPNGGSAEYRRLRDGGPPPRLGRGPADHQARRRTLRPGWHRDFSGLGGQ